MKADFLFVGLNLNTVVHAHFMKHAHFIDDALKTRSNKNI